MSRLYELLFLFGALAPFLRASESPIAIACFRLVTFPLTTLAGFQYFLLASPYRAFNRLTGCLAVLAV